MAEILLGRVTGPRAFEQPVAIKRVLPHLAQDQAFVDMFADEARIIAGIRNARVVQVHEFAHDGGELFLAMEYVEGESLGGIMRRLWSRGEQIDRVLAAHIVAEACAGLHAAHELTDVGGRLRNVVHRDVSPQNVMVTYGGEVKILDFGIAKASGRSTHTEAGDVKGKYEYMSPEQCRGGVVDRRTDIFALGILLYELTVSRRLFKRDNYLLTAAAICSQPIPAPSEMSPGYPRCLEAICAKALARLADKRYATAAAMRRDLMAAEQRLGGAHVDVEHEEELSTLMHRLFPDRIAEKREMLRQAGAGCLLERPPSAEADAAVEIPDVTLVPQTAWNEDVVYDKPSGTKGAPAPWRRWWPRGAVAVGVLGLLGVLALPVQSRLRPQPPASELHAGVGDPVVAKAPAPAEQVRATKHVTLNVESEPPGARVSVSGHVRGSTPCMIELARGSEAVVVEISRAGFLPITEHVVPNANERLVAHLKPASSHRSKTPARAPPPEPPVVFKRFD